MRATITRLSVPALVLGAVIALVVVGCGYGSPMATSTHAAMDGSSRPT